MIQKCKNTPGGDDTVLTHDKKAIQTRDTKGIAKLPKRYTLFFLYSSGNMYAKPSARKDGHQFANNSTACLHQQLTLTCR
ncbi:hypothetical protein Bca4012_031796 [Brassica carinata]